MQVFFLAAILMAKIILAHMAALCGSQLYAQ